MTESPPSSPATPGSRAALRLLTALTIFLALGDLVWFIGTFPGYFRWTGQGWLSPAIPLLLLWTFIGLPSLACAILTVRLARSVRRLGRITSLAFHLVLVICTAVPLLATLAAWNSGARSFPWLVGLLTCAVAAALWALALHVRVRPGT
jgi:hypothetical protein